MRELESSRLMAVVAKRALVEKGSSCVFTDKHIIM